MEGRSAVKAVSIIGLALWICIFVSCEYEIELKGILNSPSKSRQNSISNHNGSIVSSSPIRRQTVLLPINKTHPATSQTKALFIRSPINTSLSFGSTWTGSSVPVHPTKSPQSYIDTPSPTKRPQTPSPSKMPETASPTRMPIPPTLTLLVEPNKRLQTSVEANISNAPTRLLQNLNATQILEYFQSHPLQHDQIPELFLKPRVDDFETMAIYSKRNWSKLRSMLLSSSSSDDEVTMLVNAGSSLAGGGLQDNEETCTAMWARSFPNNVTIIDRAHGNRNTFHATQNMHTYFPRHADVLLWEFAINDFPLNVNNNQTVEVTECQNQMILYFEQLVRVAKQRNQDPPLVIMLYLWNWPFQVKDEKIYQTAFEAHRSLVENYDFVVGHVALGRYMESWQLGDAETKAVALADCHHPNARGHMIMNYLLNDFVMNENRPEKPKEQLHQQVPRSYSWMCGDETTEKLAVRDLVTHRFPIASYTGEVPKNEELLHGMVIPYSNVSLSTEVRARSSPSRRDRQECLVIPCCHTASIKFDVSRYSLIQGIQAHLHPEHNGTTVFFDGVNVTSNLISARHWHCTIGHWAANFFDWVILDDERNVTEISFCNHLPTCGTANASSNPSPALMSLTLYGGTRNVPL